MFKGLTGVLLYVGDFNESLTYYRDRLGFDQEYLTEGFAILHFGPQHIMLHRDTDLVPGYLPQRGQRGKGIILYLEVTDVDAYWQRLKDQGVPIHMEPKDQDWGYREMYLYDPDGYNLCFYQQISPS